MTLDAVDLRILREPQGGAGLSNAALTERVRLSRSACLARVKALESTGLIRQYLAPLDPQRLGLTLNVFISISLKQQTRAALDDFKAKVSARDEIMERHPMSGEANYLIRVAVTDIAALERFIIEQLSPMREVEKIRSSFALKQVRYKTASPLPLG